METTLIITLREAGQRLDVFCVSQLPGYSRSAIQRGIKEGRITVNEELSKPRYTLKAGEKVVIDLDSKAGATAAAQMPPVAVPIIYEDRDVVVVNKPPHLSVHPGSGPQQPTVSQWFADRYPASVNVGENPERPGIVHRLDKDTSGVLILAKTQPAYEHLKDQFQRHRAHKEYLALVFGQPGESKGRINRALLRSRHNPLRRTIDPTGKEAITEWKLEQKLADRFALLRIWPLTGRTHQIRVHLHFLGFPIVGDALYTFKRQRPPQGVTRQLLHAEKLTISLPVGRRTTFTAPLPADFQGVLQGLGYVVR
jgi:23S rRNA pseudouridine1911/1915/1917 synthase